MPKQLPIYKLIIDDDPDDLSGLSIVSMVTEPAIEQKYQTFSKEQKKQNFAISDKSRRIVSGPALVPNMPIYRKDETGEYFVQFDPQSIEKMVQKFFKLNRQNNSSFEHDGTLLNGVYLFESFIVDSKRGNLPNQKYPKLPDGTWFVSFRIDNDEVWQACLSGKFNGFSVEGLFNHVSTGQTYSYSEN